MSRFAGLGEVRDIMGAFCSCANTMFKNIRNSMAFFALVATMMTGPGCITITYSSGGGPSLGQLLNVYTNVETHNINDNPDITTRSGSITFPGGTGNIVRNPFKPR